MPVSESRSPPSSSTQSTALADVDLLVPLRAMAASYPLRELKSYTACDIADALLRLEVPNAGFLPDLRLFARPTPPAESSEGSVGPDVLIAPASTVLFVPKTGATASSQPANLAAGQHFVDLTQAGTIVVMQQPQGQRCAVLGGIMALRMKVLDAKGIVVHGRVRDVQELRATHLPVSSRHTFGNLCISHVSLVRRGKYFRPDHKTPLILHYPPFAFLAIERVLSARRFGRKLRRWLAPA